MRRIALLVFSFALWSNQAALASPAVDTLANCLKDNTSGKDRKDLARWIFGAMSVHPELKGVSNVSEAARADANKRMALLLTRLVTDNCMAQTRVVAQQDGAPGFGNAFKSLGEVAMMELMTNPEVAASVVAYAQYLDQQKIDAVLRK